MPALVAWIGEMLLSVVGRLAVTALLSVGIGLATHAVVKAANFGPRIQALLGNAGVLVDWVGFFGLDQAITIILSALAARAAVSASKAYFTAAAAKKA